MTVNLTDNMEELQTPDVSAAKAGFQVAPDVCYELLAHANPLWAAVSILVSHYYKEITRELAYEAYRQQTEADPTAMDNTSVDRVAQLFWSKADLDAHPEVVDFFYGQYGLNHPKTEARHHRQRGWNGRKYVDPEHTSRHKRKYPEMGVELNLTNWRLRAPMWNMDNLDLVNLDEQPSVDRREPRQYSFGDPCFGNLMNRVRFTLKTAKNLHDAADIYGVPESIETEDTAYVLPDEQEPVTLCDCIKQVFGSRAQHPEIWQEKKVVKIQPEPFVDSYIDTSGAYRSSPEEASWYPEAMIEQAMSAPAVDMQHAIKMALASGELEKHH